MDQEEIDALSTYPETLESILAVIAAVGISLCAMSVGLIIWLVTSGPGALVRANDICADMCEDSAGHAFTGLDRDYFECVCAPGDDDDE